MELGLSLGEAPPPVKPCSNGGVGIKAVGMGIGFCMELDQAREEEEGRGRSSSNRRSPDSPPVQLELLPFSPVPRKGSAAAEAESSGQGSQLAFVLSPQLGLQWSSEHVSADRSNNGAAAAALTPVEQAGVSQPATSSSPPNSAAVSFHLDFSNFAETTTGDRAEKATSRGSDEDENSGGARKKLRLSKEQSAFLEESFKEHNTLNPKQKHALAKQLNLRPRQVEVWFQNRRARTKLKQTELDCEHLKQCCERLTEENRRLQRELQELRALKATAAAHPFYGGHLPATTLSMCPSCERVAAAAANSSPSPSVAAGSATNNPNHKHQPSTNSPPVHAGLKYDCQASVGTSEKS